MPNYNAVMQSYLDLRGHTVTEHGWDTLEQQLAETSSVSVVNDFFTDYTAEQATQSEDEKLVQSLERTAVFLSTLSAPEAPPFTRTSSYVPNAGSMKLHTDVELGDVYLSNFAVKGRPYYTVYPYVKDELSLFVNEADQAFYCTADPKRSARIQIVSKQLVRLGGDATVAKFVENGPLFTCSVPHKVTVLLGESRGLLIAHGGYVPEDGERAHAPEEMLDAA